MRSLACGGWASVYEPRTVSQHNNCSTVVTMPIVMTKNVVKSWLRWHFKTVTEDANNIAIADNISKRLPSVRVPMHDSRCHLVFVFCWRHLGRDKWCHLVREEWCGFWIQCCEGSKKQSQRLTLATRKLSPRQLSHHSQRLGKTLQFFLQVGVVR